MGILSGILVFVQFILSVLILGFIAATSTIGIAFICGLLYDKSKIAKTIEDEDNYITIGIVIFIVLIIIDFKIASKNNWDFYYLIELLK